MPGYSRQGVVRSGSGWNVASAIASPANAIAFTTPGGGAGATVTHCGLGLSSSGAGQLVMFGTVTPNIVITVGIPPTLSTLTTFAMAATSNSTTVAMNNFLKLLLQNTAWALVGDATGLPASATAGSVYISLHTASPGIGGDQSTSEVTYS